MKKLTNLFQVLIHFHPFYPLQQTARRSSFLKRWQIASDLAPLRIFHWQTDRERSKRQHTVQADQRTWLIREILFEFGKC